MSTGAKLAGVLAVGLLSALATLVTLHWEQLLKHSEESQLAVVAGHHTLFPDSQPEELIESYILPSRDEVRRLSKESGPESSAELIRHATIVVQATEQLLKSEAANEEERRQAQAAEMECLYQATSAAPELYEDAFVEACRRVTYEAPGSELAAHADTYLILHRFFGDTSNDSGALAALEGFAHKYPDSKLGADLFLAYAQRQDKVSAQKTRELARRLYSTNGEPQPTDQAEAKELAADQPRNAPAKRTEYQRPTGHKPVAKKERKKRIPPPSAGGRRITFSAPTIQGRTVTTAQYHGKVVLIDFWATWCGPCVREIPNVKAVYDKYHKRGLEVIGVSLDNDPERLRGFLQQANMPWPQVFFQTEKDRGWNNPIAKRYGIRSIPTMYLLDRSGHLVTTDLRGPGALERAVEEQLLGTTTAQRD